MKYEILIAWMKIYKLIENGKKERRTNRSEENQITRNS